jgi:septal ring factor EnvC (AmiA/AmiB activator)
VRTELAIVAVLAASVGDAKPAKHAPPAPIVEPRTALADQVAAEQATLATTIDTVQHKLADADATRARRVLAALRIVDARTPDDPVGYARRIAAARFLLARDASERGLLADELAALHEADREIAAATAAVPKVALPQQLLAPANGTIARHFGDYQHERSKVTLSRRGLDFEVDDHAPAVAPADGVVRYAGPIRGLDHGVILDHGGYFTVVAKLGDIVLPVGARVAKGDRIGRAARHRVYFEVRAKVGPGGLTIDPEPLLAPR